MFTILAHAGHSHEAMKGTVGLDHCTGIIVGASIVAAILLGIIVYLLTTWQPKSSSKKIKK